MTIFTEATRTANNAKKGQKQMKQVITVTEDDVNKWFELVCTAQFPQNAPLALKAGSGRDSRGRVLSNSKVADLDKSRGLAQSDPNLVEADKKAGVTPNDPKVADLDAYRGRRFCATKA